MHDIVSTWHGCESTVHCHLRASLPHTVPMRPPLGLLTFMTCLRLRTSGHSQPQTPHDVRSTPFNSAAACLLGLRHEQGPGLRTEDGGYVLAIVHRPSQAPESSTSAAFKPSTPTPPLSCPAAKAISGASTKPPTAAIRGSSSFTNPDKDGFWDAMLLNRFDEDSYLLGDPVNGSFQHLDDRDQGATWQSDWQRADWKRTAWKGLGALSKEGAFAGSNSSLLLDERYAVAL